MVCGRFRCRPCTGTRRARMPRPLEPERAERLTGELRETVARHPPGEDLVPPNSVVRRPREVVGGRGPEALDRDRKGREHPSLRDVLLEHPMLERALGRCERERERLRRAGGQELVGGHRARAVEVRRLLEQQRARGAVTPQQRERRVHGERRGVVVGVASLVRVCDHQVGRRGAEELGDPRRKLAQRERRLLVHHAQVVDAVGGNPHQREGRVTLLAARSGVRLARREAGAPGIGQVARRAVGHVHHHHVVEPTEEGAGADRLVVRVRDHHHGRRRTAPVVTGGADACEAIRDRRTRGGRRPARWRAGWRGPGGHRPGRPPTGRALAVLRRAVLCRAALRHPAPSLRAWPAAPETRHQAPCAPYQGAPTAGGSGP